MPQQSRPQPQFKHALVSGLWDLMQTWIKPGAEKDPMLKIIFSSIEPALPEMFRGLDDEQQLVDKLTAKVLELLDAERKQNEVAASQISATAPRQGG